MMLSFLESRGAYPGQLSTKLNRFRDLRGTEHALNFRRIKIRQGETLIIHYGAAGQVEIRRLEAGAPRPTRFSNAVEGIRANALSRPKPRATVAPRMVKIPARLNGDATRHIVRRQVAALAMPISEQEFDELAALRKSQCWGAPIFQPSHPSYRRMMARLRELEEKELAASG